MQSIRIASCAVLFAALGCGPNVSAPLAAPDASASDVVNPTSGAPAGAVAVSSAPLPGQALDLTIERRGGLGFCAQAGMVLSGTLGGGSFQGTRAVNGDLARTDCIDHQMGIWSICMVPDAFGPVTLTADQLAELRNLVHAVPDYACEPYTGIACDPCLYTTITVGGRAFSDYCCGTMKKRYVRTFSALASFLDGLAATRP